MSKKVCTHVFNGRRYKIFAPGPITGFTDIYHAKTPTLMIAAKPGTRDELETCIHEALHAENWAAKEATVHRVGAEIGDFLWRLGFRRVET